MKLNQKGFNDVIAVTIVGGILGSLFILGTFVLQEVAKQRDIRHLSKAINNFSQEIIEVSEEEEYIEESEKSSGGSYVGNFTYDYVKDVEGVDFSITGIPSFNGKLSFNKPHCGVISLYSEFIDKDRISAFCRDNYNTLDYIQKDNFILEVNESEDLAYNESEYRIKVLEYNYGELMNTEELEEYVDKYKTYMQGDFEQYKVSLFLEDDIGKDEVARWYFTQNTLGMNNDDLKYWNYCEAGCGLWPKEIKGDYILWESPLDPATGAGNMCWRVGKNERGNYEAYEGDEQTKCEIRRSRKLLENISIF